MPPATKTSAPSSPSAATAAHKDNSKRSKRRTQQPPLSPNQARQKQLKEADFGMPEHDLVSLEHARARERRILRSRETQASARRELRDASERERQRVLKLMSELESSSASTSDDDDEAREEQDGDADDKKPSTTSTTREDEDGAGDEAAASSSGKPPMSAAAHRRSRIERRLRNAASAAAVLRDSEAVKAAAEEEWRDYNQAGDVKLSREDARVILGHRALSRERARQQELNQHVPGAAERSRALDYSTSRTVARRSPERQRPATTGHSSKRNLSDRDVVEYDVSSKGRPATSNRPQTRGAQTALSREEHHQPPLAIASGVLGFGDGRLIEAVTVNDAVVADLSTTGDPSAAQRSSSGSPSSSSPAAAAEDHQSSSDVGARIRAWNSRLVELIGTLQVAAASHEAEQLVGLLLQTSDASFAAGAEERQRLVSMTFNNVGLVHSRAHRPVMALEAFEKSLAADEVLGVGASPTTLLNVAATLTALGKYDEAAAIAESVVRAPPAGAQPAYDQQAATDEPAADPDVETRPLSPDVAAERHDHEDSTRRRTDLPSHIVVLAERQLLICRDAQRARQGSRDATSRAAADEAAAHASRSDRRQRPWRQTPSRRLHMTTSSLNDRSVDTKGGRGHATDDTLADVSAIEGPPGSSVAASSSHAADRGDPLGLNVSRTASRNRRRDHRPQAAVSVHQRRPSVARLLETSASSLGARHPTTRAIRLLDL